METYSPKENDAWYGKQAAGRSAEKGYDMLTDNGRLLIKALLGTDRPLSLPDLEKRTSLKQEEFRRALVDARFFLNIVRTGKMKDKYEIALYYRSHLKRIVK